jgi:hypothetical protein
VSRNGELAGVDLRRALGIVEDSRDYLLGKAGLSEWLAAQGAAMSAR